VTAGSYLGEVHCATHIFSPLRVDVEEEGSAASAADSSLLVTRITETYRGNDWANQGGVVQRVLPVKVGGASAHSGVSLTNTGPTFLVAPLVLQTKSYYSERSSFDVLSLLKNPMILMAIVALVMMVGMPYMMDQSMFLFPL
jgi:ER membrane protein complex subunit 7